MTTLATVWKIQEPRPEYKDFLSIRTGSVQPGDHMIKNRNVDQPVPSINLQGKWLIQAGFNIDKTYQVEVFKNQLLITAEET